MFALSFACSAQPSPTPTTTTTSGGSTPPTQTETKPEESPPPKPDVMTPEECASKGGTVKNDIGDGKVACGEGERELGRVRVGIEGGLCCTAGK